MQRRCKALYRKLCSEMKIAHKHARQLMKVVQISINQFPSSNGTVPLTLMTGMKPRTPIQCVAVVGGVNITDHKAHKVGPMLFDKCQREMANVRAAMEHMHRQQAVDKIASRKAQRDRNVNGPRNPRKRKTPVMPNLNIGQRVLVAFPKNPPAIISLF